MTPEFQQAENYIKKIIEFTPILSGKNANQDETIPVVIEFEFCLKKYYENDDYSFEEFCSYDEKFAKFVLHNRTENVYGEAHHSFDIIFGVMSDSLPIFVIQDLKNHTITYDEAIERLMKATSVKQLSLHNQELCDIIKPRKVIRLDSGKELNVDDYNSSTKEKH